MKRPHAESRAWINGILCRWKIALPMSIVILSFYVFGYMAANEPISLATLLVRDLNPIPWFAAIWLIAYYFRQYDHYVARHEQRLEWPRWQIWSFVAGVLMTMCLWESPINVFVRQSMALYTIKLMGEFELAAPLIVFGIPFKLIDSQEMHGIFWGLLRFMHRPFVSAIGLAVILVVWDMANQMLWGFRSPLVFAVLPGVYLIFGIIVWMQSLQVFPLWPNLRNHLRKAVYVWIMELAMMGMGGVWFWSAMSINPSQSLHMLWDLSPLSDQHLAGLLMTALALPTMCLVTWHFWQWMENILRDPDGPSGPNTSLRSQET
ncbi:MAG: cytochrome c oxidase assembly protein [Acidiferrobacter sp.]